MQTPIYQTEELKERIDGLDQDRLYSTRDLAKIFCCSISTIRMWRFKRYITPIHIGRLVRYKAEDVRRILKEGLKPPQKLVREED